MNHGHRPVITLATLIVAVAATPATANERHFAYTYESAVLAQGRHEFEVSTTWRVGRDEPYSAFDDRVEFEYGVTDRLQGSLYFNWQKESVLDPATGTMASQSQFRGLSNEWKLKLSDPVADPVGFALYGELGLDTNEAELELKLIADKALGPVLFAYNAVVEPELDYHDGVKTDELNLEHDLGLTLMPSAGWSIGGEVREHSFFDDGDPVFSDLYAGPVLHAAAGEFWITATTMFQLPALKRPGTNLPGHRFDLVDGEKVDVRVLVSLPF
jgi:hypothetical protein